MLFNQISLIKRSMSSKTQFLSGDIQEGRKITITKNGTLNMYIAVDISDSLTKDDINKSIVMVKALIERVSQHVHTHEM